MERVAFIYGLLELGRHLGFIYCLATPGVGGPEALASPGSLLDSWVPLDTMTQHFNKSPS